MTNEVAPRHPDGPAPPRGDQDEPQPHEQFDEWRKLLAEGIGTFALTAAAAAPDVVSAALHVTIADPVKAVAPGMTVAVLIYVIADISDAHVNPAVTLGFALRGAFPWRRVPGYWSVQVLGALAAALTLRGLLGVPVSGASVNPARALGPVLAGGQAEGWWLYGAGPVAGTAAAVARVSPARVSPLA